MRCVALLCVALELSFVPLRSHRACRDGHGRSRG
jgi:hypothetical protein